MSPAPIPDPAFGHDGEWPSLPGDGTRDAAPSAGGHEEEWDAAADMAQMLEDIEEGLIPIPPEDEQVPAVTFSVGEAADVDPAELAAMAAMPGPDGLGGQCFSEQRAADAMRPGPLLAVLTEQASGELGTLSGDELLGVVSAARRLQNRAEYLELAAIAEFTRRAQACYAASVAAKARPGRRDGEFAAAELAMELVARENDAADRMEFALALTTRLSATFAGLAAGTIDGAKASAIWFYTRCLTDADAAEADAILAAAAPGLRYDQLARKAAKLEMKLDPEAVRRRKEQARAAGRRVETRRELSGNMSFGGRELSAEEALAAKAYNDADAAALRRAGMIGNLRELRVMALLDRIAGRNPFDRIAGQPADPSDPSDPADPAPSSPGSSGARLGDDTAQEAWDGPDEGVIWCPARDDDDGEEGGGARRPGGSLAAPGSGPGSTAGPAPVPALINLVVPAGTLLGWSTTPGEAGSWGLLDADDTRAMVHAASQHPATRWCLTVTGPDGTAIAHGCARGPRQWTPDATTASHSPPAARAGPDAYQRAQLAELLRALDITLSPIAKGSCDHRHREDRYTPSRALKHLVRARTATCPAPGCNAQAIYCDLDHTIAWPGGPSCECNFGPPCRRHHRVKQAPGWRLEQPAPGVMRWTTPSGRTYTTTSSVYDM